MSDDVGRPRFLVQNSCLTSKEQTTKSIIGHQSKNNGFFQSRLNEFEESQFDEVMLESRGYVRLKVQNDGVMMLQFMSKYEIEQSAKEESVHENTASAIRFVSENARKSIQDYLEVAGDAVSSEGNDKMDIRNDHLLINRAKSKSVNVDKLFKWDYLVKHMSLCLTDWKEVRGMIRSVQKDIRFIVEGKPSNGRNFICLDQFIAFRGLLEHSIQCSKLKQKRDFSSKKGDTTNSIDATKVVLAESDSTFDGNDDNLDDSIWILGYNQMSNTDKLIELKAASHNKHVQQKCKDARIMIPTCTQLDILPKCSFESWWAKNPELRRDFCEKELRSASMDTSVIKAACVEGITVCEGSKYFEGESDGKVLWRKWKIFCCWYYGVPTSIGKNNGFNKQRMLQIFTTKEIREKFVEDVENMIRNASTKNGSREIGSKGVIGIDQHDFGNKTLYKNDNHLIPDDKNDLTTTSLDPALHDEQSSTFNDKAMADHHHRQASKENDSSSEGKKLNSVQIRSIFLQQKTGRVNNAVGKVKEMVQSTNHIKSSKLKGVSLFKAKAKSIAMAARLKELISKLDKPSTNPNVIANLDLFDDFDDDEFNVDFVEQQKRDDSIGLPPHVVDEQAPQRCTEVSSQRKINISSICSWSKLSNEEKFAELHLACHHEKVILMAHKSNILVPSAENYGDSSSSAKNSGKKTIWETFEDWFSNNSAARDILLHAEVLLAAKDEIAIALVPSSINMDLTEKEVGFADNSFTHCKPRSKIENNIMH